MASEEHSRALVIGIGASAGGVEAVGHLVSVLDAQAPLAYVILQHLSPSHRSMMVEILGRDTRIQVVAAEDGVIPLAGHAYVVPANRNAVIRQGRLQLTDPGDQSGPRPSINEFFISLASEQGEQAAGIVLSGTGTDGTAGLRAIQAAGGVTIAQSPQSAKYGGMPLSAVESGVADFVLDIDQIASRLPDLLSVSHLDSEPFTETELKELFGLLRVRCNLDFSGYKPGTLARRIRRRISATGHTSSSDYLKWVHAQPEELDTLSREILISVTSFFRDREAFEALSERVRAICTGKREDEEIRVWIAGCATGEEAYSVAILFAQVLDETQPHQPIQIFATDIDEEALAIARRGLYPAASLAALPEALVERYFLAQSGYYEVSKRLRDMVVFARHNLVDDPTFLRIDLVTCRNVLIYFDNALQARVFQRFHFAMQPSGVLFLGRSESIGQAEQLFSCDNRKDRIFTKRGDKSATVPAPSVRARARQRVSRRSDDAVSLLLAATIADSNWVAILSDASGRILHTAGSVEHYLHFRSGPTDLKIGDALVDELRDDASALLLRYNKIRTPLVGMPHQLGDQRVQVAVCGVPGDESEYRVFLIKPIQVPRLSTAVERSDIEGTDVQLREDLSTARAHLQAVVEELATANEEMQSLNEEAQASNEELQATNEELEASNEELQATNEELISLNDELNAKTAELARLNSEYNHLYDALEFPILVFDREGNLRRFNAPANRRFNLRSTAVSQHVQKLRFPDYMEELPQLMQQVLEQGDREERLVRGDGRIFQVAITPGVNSRGEIQTLILSVVDITEVTETRLLLKESEARLQTVMENTNILLALKDLGGHYIYANRRFIKEFSLSGDTYQGCKDSDLFALEFAHSLTQSDLEAIRFEHSVTTEHRYEEQGGIKSYLAVHQLLCDHEGRSSMVLVEMENITQRKQAEHQLRVAARVFDQAGEAIVVTAADGHIISVNDSFSRITGYACDEAVGQPIGDLLRSGRHSTEFYRQFWDQLKQRGYWQGEIWNKRKDGEVYPEWLSVNRVDKRGNEAEYYVCVFSDISNLKDSQRQVEFLATHDSLTGLPNRNLFQDRLTQALAQARRRSSMLAVLFIDLDNFKSINDTLGHHAGDDLLVQVAERLRDTVRDVDTLARMSGDEFTVMLLDCDVEEVEYISMRLLSHLSTAFHLEDRKVFVSASIGAALYPVDAEDMEGLIRAADTAMYHAKDDGRNRMRLFKPELRTRLLKESAVENALTEAIRQKNLRLVYQPQFDATDPQRIVSAEALLRWTDPTLGVVSPGEFIPIAERSGLISSLGKLTEQLLVEQLSQWRSRGLQVPPVALNVSARSFQEQEFASRFSALLDAHHLPRDAVRIEITEGSLMSSSEREEGAIERFRATGLALSVDDFGTGYSSLGYLKRLPVTEVKIDKVFVDGLGQDEGDEAIALAIIGMAHALGMITVAEGVEYQHQLDWLCQNGCDLLQGFLLAKPLEAEEFAARLASR